jgi:hypothetical protein
MVKACSYFIYYASKNILKVAKKEWLMNFCLQITFNAIGDVQLMIIVIDKQMTS